MTIQVKLSNEELERELEDREGARKSFYYFFKRCWHVIEPGYEFVDNWHVEAICEHAQAQVRGEIKNLLINMPPRLLKTDSCSVALPAWEWITFPERKYLYGSYSFTLAQDASVKCRNLVQSNWYQRRWGRRFHMLEDQNTKDHFANDKGGERIITSPDSTLAGRGADRLNLDDPNNTRDQSDTMLDSALQWFTHVVPTRINNPKTGTFLVVQQRVHERDISGFILANDKKNWVHLCLPNEYESARRCVTVKLPSTVGKWSDPRKAEGELLFPARIDEDYTKRLRANLGEYAYAGQFMQRPSPGEGGIIKKAWFGRWKQAEPPPIKFCLQSWDTALSASDKNAYSAATTWGVFEDEHHIPNLLLLSVWRDRLEYPDLRRMVMRLTRDYRDVSFKSPLEKTSLKCKPDIVLMEAKVSGLSLTQELSRLGTLITPFDPTRFGDKIERVRKVTHMIEAGRVWVATVPGTDGKVLRPSADLFVEQCAVFPNAESRDLVDTMTQALLRLSVSGWIWHPDDAPSTPSYDAGGDRNQPLYA